MISSEHCETLRLLLLPAVLVATSTFAAPVARSTPELLRALGNGTEVVVFERADFNANTPRSPGAVAEAEEPWSSYRQAVAAAIELVGVETRGPEPKRPAAALTELTIGQKSRFIEAINRANAELLAVLEGADSPRALRRSFVRLAPTTASRNDPLFSCLGVDAALDLEDSRSSDARSLLAALREWPEVEQSVNAMLRDAGEVATRLRCEQQRVWSAWRRGEAHSATSDDVERAKQGRVLQLDIPIAWWREQCRVMDEVATSVENGGGRTMVLRWRAHIYRAGFPDVAPQMDLESFMTALGAPPELVSSLAWQALVAEYLEQRDGAVKSLLDSSMGVQRSMRTAKRDTANIAVLLSRFTRAGEMHQRMEEDFAAQFAMLAEPTDPGAARRLIEFAERAQARAWDGWRLAARVTSLRLEGWIANGAGDAESAADPSEATEGGTESEPHPRR